MVKGIILFGSIASDVRQISQHGTAEEPKPVYCEGTRIFTSNINVDLLLEENIQSIIFRTIKIVLCIYLSLVIVLC